MTLVGALPSTRGSGSCYGVGLALRPQLADLLCGRVGSVMGAFPCRVLAGAKFVTDRSGQQEHARALIGSARKSLIGGFGTYQQEETHP